MRKTCKSAREILSQKFEKYYPDLFCPPPPPPPVEWEYIFYDPQAHVHCFYIVTCYITTQSDETRVCFLYAFDHAVQAEMTSAQSRLRASSRLNCNHGQ